ncbi:MAG: hypothetical protein AB2385_11980 [Symbiobacterium sp.]|uniref:hypothetical protein n=1 Tax=Symbiobacterium sp. TaxID=1971213 RepID=UPI003463B11F
MMYGPAPWPQRGGLPAPGSAAPGWPVGAARVPVQPLGRFFQQTLPGTAVAHSHHVDALRLPEVRNNPAFQRFTEIELHELHHQIAAMGALQRLRTGDRRALESLGYNLSRFVARRQAAQEAVRALPAAVRNNADVQRMLRLVRQSNRQIRQYWPYIAQAIAAAGLGTMERPQLEE